MTDNLVQRFLLDDLDIRGAVVRIGPVWQNLLAGRDYPPAVTQLLGEMSITTLLLSDNLKQPGRLTIQLRGQGPVSLLVIDCDEALNLRCMAQHAQSVAPDRPAALLGRGQLLMSLDAPTMKEPYQSIVPLVGDSIAAIFEHYLAQSEQLASRFFLAANAQGAAGLFLQKLPSADSRDPDGWARIETLASTVKPEELLGLAPEALLGRLFVEETVRVFAPRAVTRILRPTFRNRRTMPGSAPVPAGVFSPPGTASPSSRRISSFSSAAAMSTVVTSSSRNDSTMSVYFSSSPASMWRRTSASSWLVFTVATSLDVGTWCCTMCALVNFLMSRSL